MIQYGHDTTIDLNPSQLSRALGLPIYDMELFFFEFRERVGRFHGKPCNPPLFFFWFNNIIRGNSKNILTMAADSHEKIAHVTWGLLRWPFTDPDIKNYLEPENYQKLEELISEKLDSI